MEQQAPVRNHLADLAVEDGGKSITDCTIEIAYRKQMFFSQAGMFEIPELEHEQLARLLQGMALAVPRIDRDDSVYKCKPIIG